jgi:MFS family permease
VSGSEMGLWIALAAFYALGMFTVAPFVGWVNGRCGRKPDSVDQSGGALIWPLVVILGLILLVADALELQSANAAKRQTVIDRLEERQQQNAETE